MLYNLTIFEEIISYFPALITFLITAIISNYAIKVAKQYYLTKKLALPNGYSSNFLLGHAIHLLDKKCSQRILNIMLAYTKSPGILWLVFEPHYIISEPEHLEIVLNSLKCLDKPDMAKKFDIGSGTGLVFAEAEIWKKHRKLLNPIFAHKMLMSYISIFVKHNKILCEDLVTLSNGPVFDMLPHSKNCYFDLFFECAFGITSGSMRKSFLHSVEIYLRCVMETNLQFRHKIPGVFYFSETKRKMDEAKGVLLKISQEIYHTRLQLFQENQKNQTEEIDFLQAPQKQSLVFLDYLIKLSENEKILKENEILDEVAVFIAAGVETCAIVFSFICLMLGMHQDVQQKVYNEIMENIEDVDTMSDFDLSKLVYTDKVIKETLRLFPIGPLLGRKTSDSIQIGDFLIPKNSHLTLNVINVHRNEKYYKNPLEFRPERFDNEEIQKRGKFHYLPFSGGPRKCIGWKFGTMSLKTTIAPFLRHFRVETTYKDVSSIQIEQTLTINAVQGFPVQIFSRTN